VSELTVAEVAARLGVTPGRVRQLVVSGELRSHLVRGWRLVTTADLARYEKGRRPKPAPPEAGDNPAGSIVTPG